MKYIKTFENLKLPKIGDYILTNISFDKRYDDEISHKIVTFLNNNIGKIVDIAESGACFVQYENIPKNILSFFNHRHTKYDKKFENYRVININDIAYFSNNLFDIDMIKKSKKYNL